MKKILCYGDSNTYGFNPFNGSRFNENIRWTGRLQTYLKDEYEIIEMGLNNRMGFIKSPQGFLHSSCEHFPKCLDEIENIDILILWIGTNDLQFHFNLTEEDIIKGLENLISKAKNKTDEIIIIPPVILADEILNGYFKIQFDKTSILKSYEVQKIYKKIADAKNCKLFNVNEYAKPSKADGLHYDRDGHRLIAQNLKEFINKFNL